MKRMNKKYLAVLLAACVALAGWHVDVKNANAATFSDINQDSVFLKQPSGSSLCTLVAATMLVRRGAMMNGNANWASITTDMMRSAAWVEGTGLKWNFTCGGMTVAHDSFSGNATDLAVKLSEHPEGIVVYKQKSDQQHAVLVTDYTDGIFYCADPAAGIFAGRIPITSASIGIEESNYIWYISSPDLYLTDDSGNQIPHAAVKNNKKKTLTITWKSTKGAKGYQVRFATSKKIPKGAASVILTGHRAALTDLSRGSVFYVKVRAYKLNGKKKVFGPYSGVKKGKVKK